MHIMRRVFVALIAGSYSQSGGCPEHANAPDTERCLCEPGYTCRSLVSDNQRHLQFAGHSHECAHAANHRTLTIRTGFDRGCKECVCAPNTRYLVSAVPPSAFAEIQHLDSKWDVGIVNTASNASQHFTIDTSESHIVWLRRSKGYLTPDEVDQAVYNISLNSPWSALCHVRFQDAVWTKLHRQRIRQRFNDGRLSVWMHHSLLLHPKHGAYLRGMFDDDTVRRLSAEGRYIMAIYIHDIRTEGPVIMVHPHQYLARICPNFTIEIKGATSGADMAVDHVSRMLPDELTHAHYRHLDAFVTLMKRTPVTQKPLTVAQTRLSACEDPWPHSKANSLLQDPKQAEKATLAIVVPSYDGHWPYLAELIRAIYNATQQPDQIVIASSETSVAQALLVIDRLPDPLGQDRLVFVGKRARDKISGNRNTALAVVRMNIAATMDGDDIPHAQRVEVTRWVYINYGFSVFAPSGSRSKLPLVPLPCLENITIVQQHLIDATRLASANGTQPIKLPLRIKGTRFGYAYHGHAIFNTKLWPTVYYEGGGGEDQRFVKQALVAAQHGHHEPSWLFTRAMTYYLGFRGASKDKNFIRKAD
eukprot:TRINITY_DN8418_c0_g1_i2.p1 TRINITY_DN8418_c0_g1~~TRINITY_DN8418_c0_g1_i2.p1  ORF type:complete len:588 (+),score=52.20 TRINITY_DN8418_c0_g1_i2:131-1894(+)